MRMRFRKDARGGIALVEALVYIACLTVFLSILSMAIWRLFSSQTRLTERSDRLVKLLNVGERWRDEVRKSESHPATLAAGEGSGMTVTVEGASSRYQLAGSDLVRVSGELQEVLVRDVVSSRMQRGDRRGVVFWQWDLEVRLNHTGGKTQTFTFMAVPAKQPRPI